MRRIIIKILTVMLLVFVLFVMMGFGCVWSAPNIEWSKTRTVMYKQDTMHYAGQSAVCWDGRIYYVSGESASDGIYSMKMDGSDVRFEFEAPKMTRLIATDEAFYYVGVYRTGEKNHKYYALFKRAHSADAAVQMPWMYEYTDSVCDAYVFNDNTIAVIEIAGVTSSAGTKEVLNYLGIERVVIDDWDMYYFGEDDPYSFNVYLGATGLSSYSAEITSYHNGENVQIEQASVVDIATGAVVMTSISHDYRQYIKLLYVIDDEMLVSEQNCLVCMNNETREKHGRIPVEGMVEDMWIDRLFALDSGYLAIIKQENKNNNRLYYIDADANKTIELMQLNNKVFVGMWDSEILYVQGNVVRCQEVGIDGLGDIIYEIKMPGNMVNGNVFEMAGDWLFVHKRGMKANQLQYKVNLNTHEIVDVR